MGSPFTWSVGGTASARAAKGDRLAAAEPAAAAINRIRRDRMLSVHSATSEGTSFKGYAFLFRRVTTSSVVQSPLAMQRKLISADRYPSPSGSLGPATASRTTAT